MGKFIKSAFLGIIGLVLVGGADATIIYDEAVDGDLAGDENNPTPIGSLLLGVNTVTGTHIFPDGQAQGDDFVVDLGASLEITSILLEITNFIESPGTRARGRVFSTPPFTVFDSETFVSDTSISYAGALPLASPGSYAFSLHYEIADAVNGYDWTWTIETTAIPEPSTLALLGLGLAGLGFARRKKIH